MQKAIVPSDNIGRWIDIEELEPDDAKSELAPNARDFEPLSVTAAQHEGLRFQPFRGLAARWGSLAQRSGASARRSST